MTIRSDDSRTGWAPRITGTRAERVLEILDDVGRRLFDDARITTVASEGTWRPSSLASGYPGLALCGLALERVLPDSGYDQAAADSVRSVAAWTSEAPITLPGMLLGGSGIAFSVEMLAARDDRYLASARRIRDQVAGVVLAGDWSIPTDGLSFRNYDAVSGAAGALRYLLTTAALASAQVDEAIAVLLGYITEIGTTDGPGGLPGWLVDPAKLPRIAVLAKDCPHGFLDIGLAHGVSGLLVAASLAWEAGHRVDRLDEAIRRFAHWLIDHRTDDEWGVNWPNVIPLAADGSPVAVEWLRPSRTAWCYGSMGIMRALWLAGRATGERVFADTALEALRATTRRPMPFDGERATANICHGDAGLLATLLRFSHETETPGVDACVDAAVDSIIARYDPGHVFGFRDSLRSGERTDDPGFLTGAAGVCMALSAAVTSAEPDWDRSILIS